MESALLCTPEVRPRGGTAHTRRALTPQLKVLSGQAHTPCLPLWVPSIMASTCSTLGNTNSFWKTERRIESFQRLSAVVVGSQLIKPGPDLQCPDLTLCTLHPLAILLYNEPGCPLYMMAPTERFGVGGYVSPEPTLRSQDRFKRCASAWGYFPAPALLHRLILVSE